MNKLILIVEFFLCGAILSGCSPRPSETTAQLETYAVVAARSPSDVAMFGAVMTGSGMGPGATLEIGEDRLRWIDGRDFAEWSEELVKASPLGMGDPVLGDVYWNDSDNPAEVRMKRYAYGDQVIGEICWIGTQVALIAAPGGSPVFVLERVLSKEKALALEAALKDRKFDPGPVDGVIDAQTRRALGFYYESLGLEYRFQTPVITSAMLRDLIGEED